MNKGVILLFSSMKEIHWAVLESNSGVFFTWGVQGGGSEEVTLELGRTE